MRILKKYSLEDFVFLDIETAHIDNKFDENSPLYEAWYYDKMKECESESDLIDLYFNTAALYAEYGKIVCITIGIIRENKIRLKSFKGEEKHLLEDFNEMLETFVNNKSWLCGHAVTGFDAPYIMKRCLANQVEIHSLFDVAHLKPWEVNYLDTMTLWKSTSWKPSSLIALTTALGLPSSKDDISGKDVGRVFYEGGIDRIVTYCEKDVVSVINIVLKIRREPLLEVSEDTEEDGKPLLTYLFNGGKYTEEVKEKLQEAMSKLNKEDATKALEVLNAIPTKAKGKITDITKKDIAVL